MSDHDQPAPGDPSFDDPGFADPGFEDPGFEDLRGLLAETRVTAPIPGDVAARLDATLATLRDEQQARREDARVVVLRRRVGRVLVAAAAVSVIGAGSYGLVHSGQGSNSDSAASSTGGQADADKAAPLAPQEVQRSGSAPDALTPGVASLRSAHFARDAAAAMRSLSNLTAAQVAPSAPVPVATPSDSAESGGDYLAKGSKAAEAPPVTATPEPLTDEPTHLQSAAACTGPSAPGAVTLPATLDGVPVALVFRPPTASGQLVEAWSCDGASLLDSATVPR